MWLQFPCGVNKSIFVIFQDKSSSTQKRSWYICDKRRFSCLTFHLPSFHIPFSPVIASRKTWQTLSSPSHVRIFYPPYSHGRCLSQERLKPAPLSMLCKATFASIYGFKYQLFMGFPNNVKVVNKTQERTNRSLIKKLA